MVKARAVAIPQGPITDTTPLRLEVAAALAYPDGSMTVSGLRRERDAGRLDVELTAGKEYTTLHAIEQMRKQCRGLRKAPVSTPRQSGAIHEPGSSLNGPSGSSETVGLSAAQASLSRTIDALLQKPNKPSADTSPKSTRPRGKATVHSLPSRSPTSSTST